MKGGLNLLNSPFTFLQLKYDNQHDHFKKNELYTINESGFLFNVSKQVIVILYMKKEWTPNSWKQFKAEQQPDWEKQDIYHNVLNFL